MWIVAKKPDSSGNKQYRLVIDYRKLNSLTIADKYPIPEIEGMLSHLGDNSFFTTLDLKSGFHQIPLKPSDIEKTAFSVNNGKFEFTRLPFGLKKSRLREISKAINNLTKRRRRPNFKKTNPQKYRLNSMNKLKKHFRKLKIHWFRMR